MLTQIHSASDFCIWTGIKKEALLIHFFHAVHRMVSEIIQGVTHVIYGETHIEKTYNW